MSNDVVVCKNTSIGETSLSNNSILQSVDNALRVLELFKTNEELGVTQIALELNIAKSSAFRLLNTLREWRYVTKNEETDQYCLGIQFAIWGEIAISRNVLVSAAKPHLVNLAMQAREISYLTILEDDFHVRFIDRVTDNSRTTVFGSQVGSTMPAYCTASGKSLLANLSDERLEEYFKIVKLEKLTDKCITDKTVLKAQLEEIKKLGYSFDDEESEHGLSCIATAIINSRGKAVAAISISGPTGRITLDMEDKIKLLKDTAEKILIDID